MIYAMLGVRIERRVTKSSLNSSRLQELIRRYCTVKGNFDEERHEVHLLLKLAITRRIVCRYQWYHDQPQVQLTKASVTIRRHLKLL